MTTLKLGASRTIYEGIRDMSGRVAVNETIVEPTHVPIIFLLAAKQHDEPLYMFPSQIGQFLGSQTVERGSKYFSHQSQVLEIIAENANPFLYYPVKTVGSKKAFVRLSLAVTHLRTQVGFAAFNDGDNVVDLPEPMQMYNLAWLNGTDVYPEDQREFGAAQSFWMNEDTQVFPILETELDYAGEYGNEFALQIKQITSEKAPNGVGKDAVMPFTLSVIEKLPSGKQRIVKTVFGEDTVTFSLDPDAMDRLGRPLYLPLVFQNYYNINAGSTVLNYGEFGDIKIYDENVEQIQNLLWEEENVYDDFIPDSLKKNWTLNDGPHRARLLNIFTGKMYDGNTSYSTFRVDKALLIGDGNVAYAQYGDSGIPENKSLKARFNQANAILDSFVYDLKSEIESPFSNLHNRDRWDFSIAYDSGFAPQAKESLIAIVGARKDVSLFLTPHSYGEIEVVPDIPTLKHEGYMRGINNFQPIPYDRIERIVEIKGLITNMQADRVITEFKYFVDGTQVNIQNFAIDERGYWTADTDANAYGIDAYTGSAYFTAKIGVRNEPDFPVQDVISTSMDYSVLPPALPELRIWSVWNSQPVPYTKNAGEYTGPKGAIVAKAFFGEGTMPVNTWFDVLQAKFILGNGKELDITSDFSVWEEMYGTPLRADFLKGYDKKGTVKIQMRIRDRLSLEVKTIESPVTEYTIGFPLLNPVVTVTEVNNGQPVLPAYSGISVPTVPMKGRIEGLGIDNLLALDRIIIKIANVVVTAATVNYTLDTGGEFATFEATVPRGFFPILAAQDQNINVTDPAPGVVGESYHAKADVEVDANYKQKHLANAILPLTAHKEVFVSDTITISSNWDGVVAYSAPVQGVVDPNNGVILVPNIPVEAGIQNAGVLLNGSFFDYQQIVTATAQIGGRSGSYDLKVLNNFTVGAARIVKENLWPGYIKNGVLNYELTVKHRTGVNIKMNLSQPYTVQYPVLGIPTTKVTSINTDNTVWFDEGYGNPNKTIPIAGEVTGMHELRRVKTAYLSVNGVARLDVPVTFNYEGTNWTANLPVSYLNLDTGGSMHLALALTFIPDGTDTAASVTAKTYTVKKLTIPTLAITSVNNGQPVSWVNGQSASHTTEIIVTGFSGATAVNIDPAYMGASNQSLTVNGTTIAAANIAWSTRVIGGLTRLVATVKTSNLIFQNQPFASEGVASGSAVLTTNHNNRPYTSPIPQVVYEIAPKLGVVALSIDSYNNNAEIDPLNSPTATYALRGTVTGLTPNQSISQIAFKFQGNAVNSETFQLGTPTTDAGGFLTYPYTATFVGSNHLNGIVIPTMAGYSDSLTNNQPVVQPSIVQSNNLGGTIPSTGWTEVIVENGENGRPTPTGYEGVIKATASIYDTVSDATTSVDNYADLEYDVIPKRIMKVSPGARLSQFLDPMTDVLANQARKLIDFNLAMARSEFESIQSISIKVGNTVIPNADLRYHERNLEIGYGNANYQRYQVALSIPNRYLIDNGEYLEMELPIYENGESAVGLYKAPVTVTVVVRDSNGTDRTYTTVSTLFSRAYYGIKAVAEILSINNGTAINRWAPADTIIPIQLRVKDLYHRAMKQDVAEFNLTVDNKVLNTAEITAPVYSAAQFYNSVSTATMTASVKLGDFVELMDVWLNSGRVEPFIGQLGFAPKVKDHTNNLTQLTKVTRNFTAVEVLPASVSTLNIESVNNGSTVILNSISTLPIEVKAVVDRIHPVWSERIDPTKVVFSINGNVVPKADYAVTVTNGSVDENNELEAMISIKAAHEVYARYFEESEQLENGIPVQGNVTVAAPLDSNYGLRASLTDTANFLAGLAVEGPEDDVTVASMDGTQTITTSDDGFRVVDLTTGELLASGDTIDALATDAEAKGEIELGFVYLPLTAPVIAATYDGFYQEITVTGDPGLTVTTTDSDGQVMGQGVVSAQGTVTYKIDEGMRLGGSTLYTSATGSNVVEHSMVASFYLASDIPGQNVEFNIMRDSHLGWLDDYAGHDEGISATASGELIVEYSSGETHVVNIADYRGQRWGFIVDELGVHDFDTSANPSKSGTVSAKLRFRNLNDKVFVAVAQATHIYKFFDDGVSNVGYNLVSRDARPYAVLKEIPSFLPASIRNLNCMFWGDGMDNFTFANATVEANLALWDVSHVEYMVDTFAYAKYHSLPIGAWTPTNLKYLIDTFGYATFNTPINWITPNLIDTSFAFEGPGFNNTLWLTMDNVIKAEAMFIDNNTFSQDLSGLCVANLTVEPMDFNRDGIMTPAQKPVWGTCPNPL